MSTSTTGTGTITLGSALTGFQTFDGAGVTNGQTVRYVIEDGDNFEIGSGAYTTSGTTLARGATESSNSDNAISLSGSATVFIAAVAADIFTNDGSRSLTTTGVITGGTVEATADTSAGDNAAMGHTSAEGLILTGQGSTNDVTIKNDADADVLEIPTGTTNVTVAGNLGVGGTVTATGTSVFATLDISGDVDVDGTLESDAITLNGTAVTATATLNTGISNNNVPKFTSGVADNDFLRVDGTAIEGRSAAEVLSDIGGQASLTFGISNTNAVKIDSASVADDEYARFTAAGLESRATSEVLSDIGAAPAAGSSNVVTTGALNSGSITSGFGTIDTGSSTITTTGVITGGTLEATTDTAAGDNAAIGYTAAEGLILTGQGSTSDITLKNDADAVVFTVPTGTDDILFPDNAKAMFGAGSDLQIFHDGSNSFIRDKGTGLLVIDTDGTAIDLKTSSSTEYMARFVKDGAVSLYYDNAVKLATASAGVTVTGTLTATAIAGSGAALTGGVLFANVTDVLEVGYTGSVHDNGTKSSGTLTPDEADGNFQKAVNGGAHTLAPPAVGTNEATVVSILYTNNASAGAVTISGFTKTAGVFSTTNAHEFIVRLEAINDGSTTFSFCTIEALQ